jgi:hypothetical protein
MEDWELDFEWLRIRHLVKDATKRDALPDLNGVLLMIGVQELGHWRVFTKEEKQDLMHIAVCRLLSYDGVYEFIGLDTEGWPHYRLVSKPDIRGENGQERLLKEKAVQTDGCRARCRDHKLIFCRLEPNEKDLYLWTKYKQYV